MPIYSSNKSPICGEFVIIAHSVMLYEPENILLMEELFAC